MADLHARTEPERIGPYEILSKLGEGGMGTVWLARQHEPIRRRVAVKVIKRGMDSRQVLARFATEREALSKMEHHNIARVLDAGETDDGLPFVVMELVEGKAITDFCAAAQLDVDARLALFRQVCAGVQHAHERGVIHRDLKPTNVLVTTTEGEPAVKIIDFGLARATDRHGTDTALATEQGAVVGTPEYMSPEQAGMAGAAIAAPTDVYALGVLLYELLAGELPFSRKTSGSEGFVEIQRRIREDDPPRPSLRAASALGRRLRGDLDWIVMKALEKNPQRRYASAVELSADIGRHLDDQPVTAGPPTVFYRLRKLLRRRRSAVIAAAGVVLALGIGVAATAWYLSDANAEPATDRALSTKIRGVLDKALALEPPPSKAPAAGARLLLARVLDDLRTLDDVNSSLTRVLGGQETHHYTELYEKVRAGYATLLRRFFIEPAESWMRRELMRDRSAANAVVMDRQRSLLAAFEMITGKRVVDSRWLRRILAFNGAWSWDSSRIGTKHAMDDAEKLHFDAFFDLVCDAGGWQIARDDATVSKARAMVEASDRVTRTIRVVMPRPAGQQSIGNEGELRLMQLPEAFQADVETLREKARAAASGPQAVDLDAVRAALDREIRDGWARYLAEARPKPAADLDDALEGLRHLAGRESALRATYRTVHRKLAACGLVKDPAGTQWLDRALVHVMLVEKEAQGFVRSAPVGQRFLADIEKNGGVGIRDLQAGVRRARQGIWRAVRNVDPALRSASRRALGNVVAFFEDACVHDAAAEADAAWAPLRERLETLASRYPFAAGATERVSAAELRVVFESGGEFDRVTQRLVALAAACAPSARLDPGFRACVEWAGRVRSELSKDDSPTASITPASVRGLVVPDHVLRRRVPWRSKQRKKHR